MSPTSGGAAQQRFDRLVDRLAALYDRVLTSGTPLDAD
jgi:hypothetical protein